MRKRYHLSHSIPIQHSAGTSNRPIRPRIFALGLPRLLFILLSACALSLSPAQAGCQQWDVSGRWVLQQSDGYGVTLTLQQNGTAFTGSSSHDVQPTENTQSGLLHYRSIPAHALPGTVVGHIQGNDFYMNISWGTHNDTHGIYRGRVSAQGRIEGSTFHLEIPNHKATWVGSTAMKCADVAPPPLLLPLPRPPSAPAAPTAAPTTKSKVKPLPPTPTPEPEAEAAGISASEANGSVTLTWNAGGGHPNTEVWVKVNDHDEKLLFTGSRGTKTVSVKPGKKYLYILREAGGEQLDTTTIKTGR